jgi:hypothetical protein
MDERRVIELTGADLTRHGLISGKLIDGRWEVSKSLADNCQVTYVSEPGESLDKAVRKLKKRIDSVLWGRWITSRRRARQRELNAS